MQNSVCEDMFMSQGSSLPDGGNPVQLLKERGCPFDLALNEGKQTKKNKRFMDLRKIVYEGKTIDITAHLKNGNGRAEMILRLHYYQDNEKKKLIIGHFGEHLDNASTKNL